MNTHYLNRYHKLIEYRRLNPASEGEMHHILPKCMGGDDSYDNLVMLTYREHYIAHYLLAKAYPEHKSLWFAFNMMKRVCEGRSVLYEAARRYISSAISKSNTGRPMSEKNKAEMGNRTKGTVIVKDVNGNRFRVDKTDPRYISGELVSYRIGYTHSEETKSKMSDNGIKGKVAYHCKITNDVIYLNPEDTPATGYIKGLPETTKKSRSDTVRGKKWWTNIETGEYQRLPHGETPSGPGWVRGRKGLKRDESGRIIKFDR